jgi:hypothetical protein
VTNVNRHIDRAVTVVPAVAVTNGQPVARSQVHVHRAELDRSVPASLTPPVAANGPPRPVAARADDRGPHRGIEPNPRPQDARRDAPAQAVQTPPSPSVAATPSAPVAPQPMPPATRGSERALDRSPPSGNERPAPRTIVVAPATTPSAQATPTAPPRRGDGAAPAVTDRANPHSPDRPQARAIERGPDGTFRAAEPRPEPRREVQPVEPPRAIAPTAPAPRPQVRNEPRHEPRPEVHRVEAPRAIAQPAPPPAPPRIEPRPSAAIPVARDATPASPASNQAPQLQKPAPRGDENRGQGREQRRSEGRGTG